MTERKTARLKEHEVYVQFRLPRIIKERLYELARLDQRNGSNLMRKILIEYAIQHSEDLDIKQITLD